MDKMWAPWRGEYISKPLDSSLENCIFCEFSKLEPRRENLVLYKDVYGFVLMNKYPYNNGHIMVIPNAHVACFEDLNEQEYLGFSKLLKLSIKVIKDVYGPHGVNVGMNMGRVAGAGVDTHLHYHIVPRWNGDTNFMPIISETKVISEHIFTSYDKIYQGFKEVRK